VKRIALSLVVFAVFGAALATGAATKKKTKKTPPAPRITAAQRAAARTEIARRMSAAGDEFENPEALDPFFASLADSTQPVHILQFGDSHTASDDWVDSMRAPLQQKYGDGGPGFVQAGRPFRGYRRFDARTNQSAGWVTQGTMSQRGDPNQGLSGVSISTSYANQTVTFEASGTSLTLFYLQQPAGGQVDITADGQDLGPLNTQGDPAPAAMTWQLAPGPHEITLRTVDKEWIRLFGWTLDNPTGLTFETLGINGAQANVILGWDETLWASEVKARNPSLVILAYGTNEANSHLWTLEQFRADMKAVIDRVRRAAPQAALLMIGPPDCGKLRPLLHLGEVVAAERDIAREQQVAFWDLRKHMGGPGAVKLWVTAGYGQADYIHMTGEGYRLTGESIVNALLEREKRHEQAKQDR
jgi:lysophospholipase L1-like esterase